MSIKPELPKGFKDYSPTQTLRRQSMLRSIEEVYRRFGFVPLQTSVGQRRRVLTGDVEIENRLWDMKIDQSREREEDSGQVTARFDLTVPLARYVAENIAETTFPFRRYEYGDVFRGETPQAGRFCEFMQFDADIVGAPIGPADAEVILCMSAVMEALGIERYVIKVNTRKLLNGLAEQLGFSLDSPLTLRLFRVMDKVDKIGLDGVLRELSSAQDETLSPLTAPQLEHVRVFMELSTFEGGPEQRLEAISALFGDEGAGAEGVEELRVVTALLNAGGMPPEKWVIDTSIARGLGYYTGPVFETYLSDLPEIGSVYSGGRYDGLISRFTGEPLPSIGTSVGVDRLFTALEKLEVRSAIEPDVDVYILTMSSSIMPAYFEMAAELRAAGLRVELNMSHQSSVMKAQMKIALARRAPVLIFCGSGDLKADKIGVKDARTRSQVNVTRAEVLSQVKVFLFGDEGESV